MPHGVPRVNNRRAISSILHVRKTGRRWRDGPHAAAKPERLIGDKVYDRDSSRGWLKEHRIKAVIPSSANCTLPYPLDRTASRCRNRIERLFCRLKNWRRIATRYD